MKKSAIALAVTAALAASAATYAETTLYGSVRGGIEHFDPSDGEDAWVIRDESSRMGVKGSEDLGNGLSAIYQAEFGFNIVDNNGLASGREQWVGLKGGFGSVKIGTTEAPFYQAIGKTDAFSRLVIPMRLSLTPVATTH